MTRKGRIRDKHPGSATLCNTIINIVFVCAELDAFLVTACSPELMDTEGLSRLKLDLVTARGVQLATLFMQGFEMALLANDACGAPVPFLMCCPWLFFDGKLFHSKLRRAVMAQNLLEMCGHDMQLVVKVSPVFLFY
jgi:hypothetical protein